MSEGAWVHDKAIGFKNNDTSTSKATSATQTAVTKLMVSNLHYELTPKDLTVRLALATLALPSPFIDDHLTP